MSNYAKLYSLLPKNQTNHIKICENNQQYVIDFLQNLLPPSDCKSITEELRKTFIFNKIKSKRKQKIKKKFFSIRQRLRLGLDRIDKMNHKINYSDLLPLNQLWLQYIRETLNFESFIDIPEYPNSPNWENINLHLMKIDFHGAKISIERSKCPDLVGIAGIIIQDTKNIFKICGMDNIIRTIPKDMVKINIYLDDGVILKAFGRELSIRPAERAVKKFKNSLLITL